MKPQSKKKIPKGTIEIALAGRRLGKKDLPGKAGVFKTPQEAADFLETERPIKRSKK